MSFLPNRIKSDVILSDDKETATVFYRFRGLAEAEAFRKLVDNLLVHSKKFFDESDEMDKFCKENSCEDF